MIGQRHGTFPAQGQARRAGLALFNLLIQIPPQRSQLPQHGGAGWWLVIGEWRLVGWLLDGCSRAHAVLPLDASAPQV